MSPMWHNLVDIAIGSCLILSIVLRLIYMGYVMSKKYRNSINYIICNKEMILQIAVFGKYKIIDDNIPCNKLCEII